MDKRSEPSADKLCTHVVKRGAYGDVWLSEDAKRDYDILIRRRDEQGARQAATIKRYFERFADGGPDYLDNSQMLKRQGRVKDGAGKQVTVFAFKAYQWRLYGVLQHYRGRPSFVGLCVDSQKKQNKADAKILSKCGILAGKL
ncbi:hypothetical protein [Afifella sp. YEN Y35]|uniref:hypothetical protein n=1 Tax=Afifella sp. YEN Y35 TaxID=3388337 RepID=UPI0039E1706E